MRELVEWFRAEALGDRPWLVLGKGPTFERRDRFDLGRFHTIGLNHVVEAQAVDVAHIIDIDVIDACPSLEERCKWLLMPRHPHVRSTESARRLEDWFDDMPVLRRLDEQGRLVWYNLSGSTPVGSSPVIGSKGFSSEAVLQILGRVGVREVRSLGVDGGRSYGSTFSHLERDTLLANGALTFDQQFERLLLIADEHGIDYRPLVEPLRIFIGTDDSQVVAHRVLEYSIRKHASVPVEVTPMLNLPQPAPRDPANRPRTTFSFSRFMIPQLCGYEGRALYLDADMLVFGDVAELADLAFGDHTVLCTAPPPSEAWAGHDTPFEGGRAVTARGAVMLLDCSRLRWKIEEIVADLDAGRYSYHELMNDLCVVDAADIADTIPAAWNELERYDPARTKLLHYTVVPTQPWKNDDNPIGELWMMWYREAVEAGAVPPDEVEAGIAAGYLKPSLRAVLRFAPTRRAVLTNASLDLAGAQARIDDLERRITAMRSSWSWRLGDGFVQALRKPRALVRRLARVR